MRCSRRARSSSCSDSCRQTRRPSATARRLGLSTTAANPQPHSHSGAARQAPRHERRQVEAAATPRRNARQKRSARRSAERHRQRQLVIRSRIICLLFVIRLRRRVRLRRDLGDLDELASQSSQEAVAKRDRPLLSRAARGRGMEANHGPLHPTRQERATEIPGGTRNPSHESEHQAEGENHRIDSKGSRIHADMFA